MISVFLHLRDNLQVSPQTGPLLAAVIAPLSTLLDIPALSEKWFFRDGHSLPDPVTNLVLSAISLALNVLANLLLILRFTVNQDWWRFATHASLVCWVLKVCFTLILSSRVYILDCRISVWDCNWKCPCLRALDEE